MNEIETAFVANTPAERIRDNAHRIYDTPVTCNCVAHSDTAFIWKHAKLCPVRVAWMA